MAPRMLLAPDFFTKYVPSVRRVRVWIYRKRHLGTYEEVLRRPESHAVGKLTFKNGFGLFSNWTMIRYPISLKRYLRSPQFFC